MDRKKFLEALVHSAGGLTAGAFALRMPGEYTNTFSYEDTRKHVRDEFSFPEGYVYLNTGGIGPVPKFVREEVNKEWARFEEAPSPGHNTAFWNELKQETARFLGTGADPSEIALISCATEGINIILNGTDFRKGDEIITSSHEHPALNIPLLNLSARKGTVIKTFDPDLTDGYNNVKRVEELITRRTKLIFISHRTETTGQLLPVKEIGALASSRGILMAVDGAQVPGSMTVSPAELNADFYTFSCHKWMLAPRRTGVLWVKKERLAALQPVVTGAYSDSSHSLKEGRLTLHPTAQKFEFGTQNELLFRGMRSSMIFLSGAGIGSVRKHNEELSEKFYEEAKKYPSVIIHSPSEREFRSSMISFSVKGKGAGELASAYSSEKIRVRPVTEASLDAVRLSFHLFNDENDLERVLEVTAKIARS